MIILGVPITDTFLAIIRRTLSGQKFYKRIAITCATDFCLWTDTSGNCIGDLWSLDDFLMISPLAQHLERIGASYFVIGLLLGVELLARIDWGFRVHHSPLLNVLRYIGILPIGRKFVKNEKEKLNKNSSNQRKAI